MPRYFFNIHDGVDIRDDEGTEVSSVAEMRKLAVRFAGELLQHGKMDHVFAGHDWRLVVNDATGAEVLTLRFSAEQAAAA